MALASTDSRYLLVSRRSAAEIERRFGPGAGRALAEVLGGTTPGLRRVLPVGPDEAAPLLVFEAERARPQGPARMLPDPARSAR